ncbi:hypothetical protein FBU30_001547 [Linnemannia zychae]|nr:hypothetical protein FBU30_001547 [Linnemannia zychae]
MTPVYSGAIATLPADISCHVYFKTSKISEWCLEHFFTSTGLTKAESLSNLKDISRIKRLPTEVQGFARSLTEYYNGVFEEEVAEIAENNASKTINQQVV